MDVENHIKDKLTAACSPVYIELLNESHMHAGVATDSHFKLTLVSSEFSDLSLIKRHQFVYKILKEELAGPVHALALHLYSPDQWESNVNVPASPQCAGKNA